MGEGLYSSRLSEIATAYGALGLLIIAFLCILYQFTQESGQPSQASLASSLVLFFVVVYLIVMLPLVNGTDRMTYLASYTDLYVWNDFGDYKDAGFGLYTSLVGRIFRWHVFPYFASITAIYVGGIVFFAKKLASPAYVFPFCLSCFINFGFWAYGINTIRAGMALSIFLIGCAIFISGQKRWKKVVLVAVVALVLLVAISIHVSIIIPIAAVLLGYFFHRPRLFLLGWIGCLVLSIFYGETIQAHLGGFFEDSEESRVGYLTGESSKYHTGFRWDFLAYSCIPIAVSFFYLIFYKVKDRLYDIAICTYLATNGFWLLIIRIPYSDRVAFLSWFIIPVVLLFPLVRNRVMPPGVPTVLAQMGDIPGKNNKIVLTLFGQLAFMLFMAFVYGAFKQA